MSDFGEYWQVAGCSSDGDDWTEFVVDRNGRFIADGPYLGRIVACVNAMAGIEAPDTLRAERDALLARNQKLVSLCEAMAEALEPFAKRIRDLDHVPLSEGQTLVVAAGVNDCRRARDVVRQFKEAGNG